MIFDFYDNQHMSSSLTPDDDAFWIKAGYKATPVACGWAGAIF